MKKITIITGIAIGLITSCLTTGCGLRGSGDTAADPVLPPEPPDNVTVMGGAFGEAHYPGDGCDDHPSDEEV